VPWLNSIATIQTPTTIAAISTPIWAARNGAWW
jgi:hypothetical protein